MDEIIIKKSDVDELADVINTKAGVTGVKTIQELKKTVENLSAGGVNLDDIDIYIADFFDKNTLNINKGILNSWERIIVS